MNRLHFGCGPLVVEGWMNADRDPLNSAVYPADLLALPFDDAEFDGAVGHHVLQAIPYPNVDDALLELRRVLRPGATLRVSVPDVVGAFDAYRSRNRHWPGFAAISEVTSVDDRFCQYVVWGGHNRTVFTEKNLVERCLRVGFSTARATKAGKTFGASWLTDLDSRPGESIYVEAIA